MKTRNKEKSRDVKGPNCEAAKSKLLHSLKQIFKTEKTRPFQLALTEAKNELVEDASKLINDDMQMKQLTMKQLTTLSAAKKRYDVFRDAFVDDSRADIKEFLRNFSPRKVSAFAFDAFPAREHFSIKNASACFEISGVSMTSIAKRELCESAFYQCEHEDFKIDLGKHIGLHFCGNKGWNLLCDHSDDPLPQGFSQRKFLDDQMREGSKKDKSFHAMVKQLLVEDLVRG